MTTVRRFVVATAAALVLGSFGAVATAQAASAATGTPAGSASTVGDAGAHGCSVGSPGILSGN